MRPIKHRRAAAILAAHLLLLLLLATYGAAQTPSVSHSPSDAAPQQDTATPPPPAPPAAAQITATPAMQEHAQPLKEGERLPFILEESRTESTESVGAVGLLARTLGALFIIVGLIVAAGWGAKRLGGARFGTSRADAPQLSVLSSVALGDRRSLAVVRFGGRNLLVGATGQSITLLAAEEVDGSEVTTPPMRSVADLLKASEAESFEAELVDADRRLEPTFFQHDEGENHA